MYTHNTVTCRALSIRLSMRLLLGLVFSCLPWLAHVAHAGVVGANKKPVQVLTVGGATNNQYSIVETTIYHDVSKGGESAPIVTRSQRAVIRPGQAKATPLNVKLEIPTPPVRIETYGASQVMTKVGQLVGVVGGAVAGVAGGAAGASAGGPVGAAAGKEAGEVAAQAAGAAITGMAAIADYAVHVAEQRLNKLYENQQYLIRLIEIVPVQYYTINTQTNQVELKPAAGDAFLAYTQQQDTYLKALKDYQDMNARYAQSHARVQALSGAGLSKEQFEKTMAQSTKLLNDTYERDVKPRLEAKNREEAKFSRMYPPYRIAIMASPAQVGNACRQFGQGQGPWELSVIYYIGAQQTNQIAVKYCVPNNKDDQFLEVTLMHNSVKQIDTKKNIQEFVPGGIKISGVRNASFARASGPRGGDYGASETDVLNWFTQMIAHPEAGGVAQFMIPFDIYELREGVAKQLRETNDKKMEKILASMDEVIKQSAEARQTYDTYKKEQQDKKKQEVGAALPSAPSGSSVVPSQAGPEMSGEPSSVSPESPQESPAPSPVVGEGEAGVQEPEPTKPTLPAKKSRIPKLTEEQKAKAKAVGGFAAGVYGIYGPPPDPKAQKALQQLGESYEQYQRATKKE